MTVTARDRQNFDNDWSFILGDDAKMASVGYDDSDWRKLDLPHDWAVEGDFSADNKSGAGGGALPGGIGWYRKHFNVGAKDKAERFYIEFDGVYMNSTVYVNGHEVGHRPYGYSSFEYDITPYIKRGGDNVIAVKVDNSDQPNSRWYSGCGIYRHVWLTKTSNIHVAHWGTHVVSTASSDKKAGEMKVAVTISNPTGKAQNVKVRNSVIDREGKHVAMTMTQAVANDGAVVEQLLNIPNRKLWQLDDPYIYNVKTEVLIGSKVVDTYYTTTGFRYFNFDAQKGFSSTERI